MKRHSWLSAFTTDVEILVQKSPMTAALRNLLNEVDFASTRLGEVRPQLRAGFKCPVVAATDPWSEVEYQSLYLTDEDPENRIILQEPAVRDPMVGVMVLKAARLRGQSGLVYCGTPEQLQTFAAKLKGFEEISEDENLDEKKFLECLVDAAEQEGLRVVYERLSPEHGGDPDGDY